MTKQLKVTLLSDGSSDQILLPILKWLLIENGVRRAIQDVWADLRFLPHPPRKLDQKIETSLKLYPCDLLFIHRDAEGISRESRAAEISSASLFVEGKNLSLPSIIHVIPVRMSEAWLLFDEYAIRQAAGNSKGKMALSLPPLKEIESLPDPKETLYQLLRNASGRSSRRRSNFRYRASVHRLSQLIGDFSPLRSLPAFSALEKSICALLQSQPQLASQS